MPRKALRIAEPRNGRPAARGAMSLTPPNAVRKRGGSNLSELFDLGGRFDRNEVTHDEINRLRQMIDSDGVKSVAEQVGLQPATLLMITSGFGHRLQRRTATRIREYLRD